ncbi:MAG: Crp/Fnr family transcriptional regulator [Spirochaetes bacterium]|nr:Crp/Fnr family transcriptional regulator [Spirochaetota bacterium]
MSLIALKKVDLFKSVPTSTLDTWLKGFTPLQREYRKGNILLIQGKEYLDLCCILSGEVSAEIQDYSGKVLKVETLKAYESIATAVLFSPDKLLPVTVVAQTDVSTLWIPRKEILRLCRMSTEFLEKLLCDMGARLSFLAQKIRFLQFNTIRKKIAEYLLIQLRNQGKRTLQVRHSREMLAEMFGVTRPALSRVFSELCKEGVISTEGKMIQVLDPVRLRTMAEEEE